MEKKTIGKIAAGVLAFGALITGLNSAYTLTETQQAVVTFQGKPVRVYVGSFEAGQPDGERIQKVREWADQNGYGYVTVDSTIGLFNTGLHFKVPFLESVVKFDDRLLEYSSEPENVQTLDKRQLIVDNYTKWYIENPLSFYLGVRDTNRGTARLDENIYSTVRIHVGKHEFNENIRTTNRQLMALDGPIQLDTVEYGREKILNDIIGEGDSRVNGYGMNVVDIRFIRVELPEQNEKSVFDRMIAERGRIASLYRAEGDAENMEIKAGAEKDAAITRANAQQRSGELLGEGESEAARIYTGASRKDPEFFQFWRTLKAYEKAFKENTRVVLSTDTEFNEPLEGLLEGK